MREILLLLGLIALSIVSAQTSSISRVKRQDDLDELRKNIPVWYGRTHVFVWYCKKKCMIEISISIG